MNTEVPIKTLARPLNPVSFGAVLCALLISLALPLIGAAAELGRAEKLKAAEHLAATREALLAAVDGLSEKQWNFKPAPGEWSIAQTLEHIVITEDALYELITQQVMKAPGGQPDRDIAAGDKAVLAMIPDRSHKVKAPAELEPAARWKPAEAISQFKRARKRTQDFLDSAKGLRDHVIDAPIGQPLDGYQWVLYISAHSDRHTKQILEVKANPRFPGN